MTTSGSREAERAGVRAAMDRLLAGTPLHSDGALTVVSLAAEAQVKRHVLTHRHIDLKDEFYAKVRAQGHVPDSERRLREDLAEAKRRLREATEKIGRLQADVEGLARVVNVLSVENEQLRSGAQGVGNLRLLPTQGADPARR